MSDQPNEVVDKYVNPDGTLKVPITEVPDELRPLVISTKTHRQMSAPQ